MNPALDGAVELLERSLAYTRTALAGVDDSPAGLRVPTPCAGWDLAMLFASALKATGPNGTPAQVCEAIRNHPFSGVLVERRDFSAKDMTGIRLSNFVFSKVTNGVYSRTNIRLQD